MTTGEFLSQVSALQENVEKQTKETPKQKKKPPKTSGRALMKAYETK